MISDIYDVANHGVLFVVEVTDDFFKYVSQPEKEYLERVEGTPKEIESC